MKRIILFMVLGIVAASPAAFADLADYMLNVNGSTFCPGGGEAGSPGLCGSTGGLTAAPGVVSTLNTTFPGGTGLGTVTETFNPGVGGTFDVGLWLFEAVDVTNPFDEYGSTSGSLATGESYQIDVPDEDYAGELGTAGAGTIISNTAASTLSDTNDVPGKLSNSDLSSCGYFSGGAAVATCDDATSMALGYSFSLTSSQEEVLTFTVSQTAPSGFYLSTTDPTTGTVDYYSATAVTQAAGSGPPPPPPPSVPEPGTWLLLGTGVSILGLAYRRRFAAQ